MKIALVFPFEFDLLLKSEVYYHRVEKIVALTHSDSIFVYFITFLLIFQSYADKIRGFLILKQKGNYRADYMA